MAWATLGDSVAGTSHRARGAPCQDASRVCAFGAESGWLAVAVADGAGSASRSEVGAGAACDEFLRRVTEGDPERLLTREGMLEALAGVRAAVAEAADRLGATPRELACTALLAVIGPDASAFAQVGDGAIVIGHGGDHRVIFWPEPAGYANATDFLTDDSFPAALRYETVTEPVTEVAALTDGLQRLALDFTTRAAHPGFFRPLFERLRAAPDHGALAEPFRAFLDSERVNARTDDDKTLVLAVRL
jgi:hypothetical protein